MAHPLHRGAAMKSTLIPRLQEFAEQSRPEWQIVLAVYGDTDLILTRQDFLDILELATTQQQRRSLLDLAAGRT